VEQLVILSAHLGVLTDLPGKQVEPIGSGRGRLFPSGPGRKAGFFQGFGVDLDLPARGVKAQLGAFFGRFLNFRVEVAAGFEQFQVQAEGRQLLANVVFFVGILEEIRQSQALAELLVNPKRRARFALRLDHRLADEDAPIHHM